MFKRSFAPIEKVFEIRKIVSALMDWVSGGFLSKDKATVVYPHLESLMVFWGHSVTMHDVANNGNINKQTISEMILILEDHARFHHDLSWALDSLYKLNRLQSELFHQACKPTDDELIEEVAKLSDEINFEVVDPKTSDLQKSIELWNTPTAELFA